jgi:competence protein ComEC
MTSALACLVAWSVGVASAEVLIPNQALLGGLALAAAALAATLAVVLRPAVICLALVALLLGVARAEGPQGDPASAARAPALAGEQAAVDGQIADDPRPLSDGYEVLVEPHTITTSAGRALEVGKLLVRVKGGAVVPAPGDQVLAIGRLELPRDQPGFDRRAYLGQRGAHLEMRNARLNLVRQASGLRALPGWLRDRYRDAIEQLLPPPHSALLIGILLGLKTGIPPRLQQDLIATGLVHLLVLSGLKVAVFARLVSAALAPLLGRAATLPALALIALYALAGGATPAGVRAAAMGGLTLAATHLGRPTHVWSSLAATAAAMLAWRPELAWDVGFQLSFAGTAAIILLTPSFEDRLRWLPGWFREPLAVTCAAQVGTVPFMATNFHVLSPVGPLANALVLPLLAAMVGAGLLIAPLALLPGIGHIAALPLTGLLIYVEQVAQILARIPGAAFPAPDIPAWLGFGYYVALGAALVAARTREFPRKAAVLVGLIVPLLIGGGELAWWGRTPPNAAVLAVGSGQAILLSGPGGFILVDGGPSPARLAGELGSRLPPWRHRLEALVITGSGLGHAGGLAELDYPAGQVIVPAGGFSGSASRKAALAAVTKGARLAEVRAGERVQLAGLELDVLAPEARAPEPGQIGFRAVGPSGKSFCDLADLDADGQAAAAARLRAPCDSLLLPSGGRSSPAPELLSAARPAKLVVSDTGGTLARDLPHSTLVRTSQEGSIVLPL